MLKHFSDERQSDRENPPRPFGFHPNAQGARVWDPGLRRKSGHTSLPASTVGPATAFGRRLVWPDFRAQRCSP